MLSCNARPKMALRRARRDQRLAWQVACTDQVEVMSMDTFWSKGPCRMWARPGKLCRGFPGMQLPR